MSSDGPEHFQSPEYYESRKDNYTQQLDMLIEALEKVTLSLFF